MPRIPTCWNCGYELTGLRVDAVCPECGTPIWSQRPAEASYEAAQKAQLWGVVSLALFFACLGPLAVIPAIAALGHARAAERECRYGTPGGLTPSGIRVGRICAWITIALSIGVLALWGAAAVFGAF